MGGEVVDLRREIREKGERQTSPDYMYYGALPYQKGKYLTHCARGSSREGTKEKEQKDTIEER